jgi:HEAT repeat protein
MSVFGLFRKPNVESMKTQGDIGGLIEALRYGKDHSVRFAAALALGKIGDTRAVKPLIRAFQDRDDIREAAAVALGKIGHPSAVEPLSALLNDTSWDVRGSAAKALGQIGDAQAVEPLIKALKENRTTERWFIVTALEAITAEAYGDDVAAWENWVKAT